MANEPGTSYMRESESLDIVDQVVDDDAGQDDERNVHMHTTQSKSKVSTNGMFDRTWDRKVKGRHRENAGRLLIVRLPLLRKQKWNRAKAVIDRFTNKSNFTFQESLV